MSIISFYYDSRESKIRRKYILQSLQNELYGPLMLIFTLSAILNYQMKLANHSVVNVRLFKINPHAHVSIPFFILSKMAL